MAYINSEPPLSSAFNRRLETEYEMVRAEKDPESPWLNSSWDGTGASLAMPISVGLVFLPCDELKCMAGMLEH